MKVYNIKTSSVNKASVTHNPKGVYDFVKPDIHTKQVIHNPHCSFNHGKHLSVAAENEKKKALILETKKENLKELKIKDVAFEMKKENIKESKVKNIELYEKKEYEKKENLKEFEINKEVEFRLQEFDSLKTNVNLSDIESKSYNRIIEEQIEYIDPEALYWTSSFMDL